VILEDLLTTDKLKGTASREDVDEMVNKFTFTLASQEDYPSLIS
jgi:hypothetical protein